MPVLKSEVVLHCRYCEEPVRVAYLEAKDDETFSKVVKNLSKVAVCEVCTVHLETGIYMNQGVLRGPIQIQD